MDSIEMLRIAYKVAEASSRDPRTQNGAFLICKDGHQVTAANYFAAGVHETPQRWEKPLKFAYVEHAERNAIYKAANFGYATQDATLFVPWFACVDCARAIIQAGIKLVVGHDAPFHNRPDWPTNHADQMFKEAGVDFVRIKHTFGGIRILFDGNLVEP